ncbi:BICD2 [Bugula neritina]|uniref:BICD2 n=1 Tax=Bugula neritina TaxID=10212 RepID=A0A7J7JJX8_BUGNE|nr:BICD2 [Bugula neritina]
MEAELRFAVHDDHDDENKIEELCLELTRLQKEIEEVNQHKIQAAEYGLAVLEEKQQLQEQLDQLELINEQTSVELQHLKQALAKHEVSSKLEKHINSVEEEQLILEKNSKEEEYKSLVTQLQSELKLTKQKLEVLQTDEPTHLGFADRLEEAEHEKVSLRRDIREFKQRESRILSDYSELEEENISLQKQVLSLQQEKVAVQQLLWEKERLKEEVEQQKAQNADLQHLREIVENNLEESIKSLVHEREMRHQLQREYDELRTQEAIFTLNKMAHLTGISSDIFDVSQSGDESATTSDQEGDSNCSEDADSSKAYSQRQQSSCGGGDLFSEIHLSEIAKFEELLAAAEKERDELTEKCSDLQTKIHGLEEELSAAKVVVEASKLIKEVEVNELNIENEGRSAEEVELLQTKITELESKICKYEGEIKELKELSHLKGNMQESLVKVVCSLSSVYEVLCKANNETPNRLMQEHLQFGGKSSLSNGGISEAPGAPTDPAAPGSLTSTADSTMEAEELDVDKLNKLILVLGDQTKYVKRSVDTALDRYNQLVVEKGNSEDIEEIQEMNRKLKTLLNTKREQIATLRSVLKANKSTAEVALANLKQKYETEKVLVTQTMGKLRNELKSLKEDAATFSSLRAMFAQRCDEYVTQLDQLQRQLSSAEEEKKTLNSLLRMAIQQKLALTQRLEDLEYDREKRSVRGSVDRRRDFRRTSSHHNHTKVSSAEATSPSAAGNPTSYSGFSLLSQKPQGLAVTVRQGTPSRSVTQEGKNRLAALLGRASSASGV